MPSRGRQPTVFNYDLALLGFDPDELVRLLDPGVKDGLCDPDEMRARPSPQASPVCGRGRGAGR
ncbi:MAG: hypothetical protein RMJ82_02630 [Gemmatales bacterium]|nr:hypothetical protein [Gemmatales bacterium]